MIVVTLVALIAGLSYPSVASGLDSLRLRSASGAIVTFLNTAVDRAERSQQAVEIWISPKDNAMVAISADRGFERRLDVPEPVHIVSVQPPLGNEAVQDQPRRFLVYPGGTAPGIGVEIANKEGRRRLVHMDPFSGFPRSEPVAP
jgi:hypothetical protein